MTPVELELLRGGSSNKQIGNNKIYLILSDTDTRYKKSLYRMHYPFTLQLSNMAEKDKLIEAINKMKTQLEELKMNNDKSQTSFSILNETMVTGEQLKLENEELKKRIKMYEDSLTQKRGAVEIDMILREKNTLEIQAESKKRE